MNQDQILKRAAQAASRPQQPAPGVVPSPAPMSVQVAQTKDPEGNAYVILVVQHLYGQNVFHFDPEGVERIADALKDAARLAKSGLEIPRLH